MIMSSSSSSFASPCSASAGAMAARSSGTTTFTASGSPSLDALASADASSTRYKELYCGFLKDAGMMPRSLRRVVSKGMDVVEVVSFEDQ